MHELLHAIPRRGPATINPEMNLGSQRLFRSRAQALGVGTSTRSLKADIFGNMADIPNDVFLALQQAERFLASPDASQEEQEEAVNLVFSTARGRAIVLAKNVLGARILEDALQLAPAAHIHGFFAEVAPSFVPLMCNKNGSHVVQTLSGIVSRMARTDAEPVAAMWADVLAQQVVPELADLIPQSFCCFVLKTILRVEAGLPPEDEQRGRRRHANEHTYCRLYSPGDEFHCVPSENLKGLLLSVYGCMTGLGGFDECIVVPHSSSLLQAYCQVYNLHRRTLKFSAKYTPEAILAAILGLDNDEVADMEAFLGLLASAPAVFALEAILRESCCPRRSVLAEAILHATFLHKGSEKRKGDTRYGTLRACATSGPASHLVCAAIASLQSVVAVTDVCLCLVRELGAILELDSSKVVPSVLESVRAAADTVRSAEPAVPGEHAETFGIATAALLEALVTSVGSADYLVRRLLLPGQPDTGDFDLAFSFKENRKYEFSYINKTLDSKDDVTREFLDARREEYKRKERLEKEAFFGTRFVGRGKRGAPGGRSGAGGIWQTGKAIVIGMLTSGCAALCGAAAASLIEHSFDTQEKVMKLSTHPAGCDVLVAFASGTGVPVKHKLLLVHLLRGRLTDLAMSKLGAQVIRAVFFATVEYDPSSQGVSDPVPADVVCEARKVIAANLHPGKLVKTRAGEDLIDALRLAAFREDYAKWERGFVRSRTVANELLGAIDESARRHERREHRHRKHKL